MTLASESVPNLVGFTIDKGRYKFTRRIGSGSSGVIFLAEDRATSPPMEVAIKCIIKAKTNSRHDFLQKQEIGFHTTMSSHPRVVTLHRVLEEGHYIFLVMDYCGRGDFFNYLMHNKHYRGDDAWIKLVFTQILDAVQACHEMGIYHRDIKPENFLVGDDGRLLLTDFGLATTNLWSKTFGAGSALYMSPECIGMEAYKAYNAQSNDIWALGVILLSMISGHNPWNQAAPTDHCYYQYRQDINFLRRHLPISDASNELLQQIFRREYVRHITLAQIRARIEAADSFYMDPEQVWRGGWNLKSAARSYFGGSPKEKYYFPWTGAGDDQPGRHEVEEGVYVYEMRPSPTSLTRVSPSSTVESSGPNTPEMRAQHMSDVEVPPVEEYAQETTTPSAAEMYPAAPTRPEMMHLSPKKRDVSTPGFLRRFMDRFVTEA